MGFRDRFKKAVRGAISRDATERPDPARAEEEARRRRQEELQRRQVEARAARMQAMRAEPAAPAELPSPTEAPQGEPEPTPSAEPLAASAEPPVVARVAPSAPEPVEPVEPVDAPTAEAEAAATDAAPSSSAEAHDPAPASGVTFKVRLLNEAEGLDETIEVRDDEYVLDAADRQGLDLPYSCRNGGCTVCAGSLVEGDLMMDGDQYVLEADQIEEGFRLLCCSLVRADSVVQTNVEDSIEM